MIILVWSNCRPQFNANPVQSSETNWIHPYYTADGHLSLLSSAITSTTHLTYSYFLLFPSQPLMHALHMAHSVKLAVKFVPYGLHIMELWDGLHLNEKVLNLQLISTILLSFPPVLQTSLKRWTVFVTHNTVIKVQTEQDIFEKCDSHVSWALVILVILVTNIRYGNLPRQLRSNIRL